MVARSGITDIYAGHKKLHVTEVLDVLSADVSFAGSTITDLGAITTADINGGTIDGAVIGATTAAAITGTTITASTEFRGPILTSNAASAVAIKTSGGTQFNVAHIASAVNFWSFQGASTTNAPAASTSGSDTDVPSIFNTKGASAISFYTETGSSRQVRIAHTASAVEYLQATGATSGNPPTLSAQGAASNLNLRTTPKGTGINISAASTQILDGTAIPAGGTAGAGYRFSSTANFGVFFGSGAPSLAAAQGSLYLRSDGSGTGNRAYINTDGSTTWTALTTAA